MGLTDTTEHLDLPEETPTTVGEFREVTEEPVELSEAIKEVLLLVSEWVSIL
jgi:hypothetical protein